MSEWKWKNQSLAGHIAELFSRFFQPNDFSETFAMRNRALWGAVGLWALSALPLAQAQGGSETNTDQTIVHVGRLMADPANGRVTREQTIVIAAGRVVEIRDGWIDSPGRKVDLRDSFVLPGLIDSHVHLTGELGPTSELDLVKKTSVDVAMDGFMFARRTLEAGFTTVADVGAVRTPSLDFGTRSPRAAWWGQRSSWRISSVHTAGTVMSTNIARMS